MMNYIKIQKKILLVVIFILFTNQIYANAASSPTLYQRSISYLGKVKRTLQRIFNPWFYQPVLDAFQEITQHIDDKTAKIEIEHDWHKGKGKVKILYDLPRPDGVSEKHISLDNSQMKLLKILLGERYKDRIEYRPIKAN